MDLRDIPGLQDDKDADRQLINYGIALSANGYNEFKRLAVIPAYLKGKHRERYKKSELIQMPQSEKSTACWLNFLENRFIQISYLRFFSNTKTPRLHLVKTQQLLSLRHPKHLNAPTRII
ncbi:hypothetical protein RF11_16466 [Thelohanellus kitauei]|uniref:Uncharacterized protein n=1 Tax=Thelohanellus kitauei TaxID=669202 RepID=A0A0C2ITC2_THEKT|nr:hypothetical protein RF11_16466 [Thelohanellus kitauei]